MTAAAGTDLAGPSRAVVIGAGWAGLTAALRLAERGFAVTILDAAPQAGGRARTHHLDWSHPEQDRTTIAVDNGQHLLIGAYVETLGLLERLGALQADAVDRLPMQIHHTGGLRMTRPRLARDRTGEPGTTVAATLLEPLTPLYALLSARGLPAGDRWALVRTLSVARMRRWRPPAGVRTVAEWYRATRQPPTAVAMLWQPLVISTMNTPADLACAATFLRVLRDSLGGPPAATDFVMPRMPLGEFFVAPVLRAIEALGGRLQLRQDVRRITTGEQRRYRIGVATRAGNDETPIEADHVVVATPPVGAARMLRPIAAPGLIADLERFDYLPITTAYVGWPAHRWPEASGLAPVLALQTDPARGHHAHWLFDRGMQGPWRIGALVISDSRDAQAVDPDRSDDALTHALIRQLGNETGLPPPAHLTLIHEKRATFACTPDRPKLHARSAMGTLPGLALAGDYAWSDYPATLEGAVRSGLAAAEAIQAAGD